MNAVCSTMSANAAKKPQTKPWNVIMTNVNPDETLYTDYKDEARTSITSVKFKTTDKRIRFWVAAHEEVFSDSNNYEFEQNLITLKHKDSSKRNLIVKFHLTTGVVLIQGSRHNEWRHKLYGRFKSRVDELCGVNTVPGDIHHHWDEDITAEKQRYHDDNRDADGGDDEGSVVISDVEEEVEVTNENDDLGDIAVHEDNRDHAYPAYDPIQRLEEAYVKLIDTHNLNMNSLRTEIVEIKHEVRKIPNKVYDCVKKDIQANTQALRELTAKLNECDDHKNQISCLTVQLRNKNTELWSLRRELAILRSPPKQQVSHREAPTSHPQGIPVEPASQGAPARARSTTTAAEEVPQGRAPMHTLVASPPSRSPQMNSPQSSSPSPSHNMSLPTRSTTQPAPVSDEHPTTGVPTTAPSPVPPPEDLLLASSSSGDDLSDTEAAHDAANRVAPSTPRQTQQPPQRRQIGDRYMYGDTEALLIGDSTTKYVAKERFMGRHKAVIQRASTSVTARQTINEWPSSPWVQYAVLHVGVNDVRDGTNHENVIQNIEYVLTNMQTKFQNAKVAFTEILYVREETSHPEMNCEIKNINQRIDKFCEENGFIYVQHSALQAPDCTLYDDNVHINRTGGTASFVSDIHRAVGLYSRSRPNRSDHQVYRRQGSNDAERNHGRRGPAVTGDSRAGARHGAGPMKYKWEGRDQGQQFNLDQMLKLVTLNMLQSMQMGN